MTPPADPRRSQKPIAMAAAPAASAGGRCAGLCAGADASDLCGGHRQPECAGRYPAGFHADEPARCRRRPGTATWAAAEAFPSLQALRCSTPTQPLRTLALGLFADSFRLRDVGYERGEARAALAQADAADLVVASYMIGEIGDARTARTRRTDVGEDRGHAARGRTRHARRLCADHRVARPVDRLWARMSPRPARTTDNARWRRPTGAISRNACSARARTSRSRARSCLSRTSGFHMSR